MSLIGIIISTSTASDAMTTSTGRFITVEAKACQRDVAVGFTRIIVHLFRRSPSSVKIAGDNVRAVKTAKNTTTEPPNAIFSNSSTRITLIAARPIMTQIAEKIMDLPAV